MFVRFGPAGRKSARDTQDVKSPSPGSETLKGLGFIGVWGYRGLGVRGLGFRGLGV